MNKNSILFFSMVNEYITVFLPKQKGASQHTIRSYKTAINQFLNFVCSQYDMRLQDFHFKFISQETVEQYLNDLESIHQCSVNTRNQKLAVLKSFCKYAGLREASVMSCYQSISAIPIKKTETKPVEFFSEKALEFILNVPDTSKKNGRRDRMFMILLYDTGARLTEILNLRLKDIHIDNKKATGKSYIKVLGKGKKIRLIPLMDKTIAHLEQYLKYFHEGNMEDYLFYVLHNGKKCRLSEDSAEKFIRKYGEQAKLKCDEIPEKLYPHMFRHSRAMHLYRNGMSLPLVSEWLGHSQIETTIKYYANADITMKQEAISKATSALDPLLTSRVDMTIEYDDETIRKLYGLT